MKQYKYIKVGSVCADASSQEFTISEIKKMDDKIIRYKVRGEWLDYSELIWKYTVFSNGKMY
jgi:hypothetical protein